MLPSEPLPQVLPQHPRRGWTLPVATTFDFGGVPARTNHLGLRSPEPQVDAPLRVLTLGDSSAFGHGVLDNETFSAQLAHLLGMDVQNAGVPGYTCRQSADRYHDVVDVLAPDILLIYSLHNDARIIRTDEAWMGAIPDTIGVLRLVASAATWIRIKRQIPRMTASEYEACLMDLIDSQAARGKKTLLITPVSIADFIPDYRAQDRPLVGDYFRAMDAVEDRTDAPLLELTDMRWAQGLSPDDLMIDPVHPNPQGHRLIAEWIYVGLFNSGLIESSAPDGLPRPGTKNSPF